MVESVDEPPLSTRLHSWAKSKAPSLLQSSRAGRDQPDSLPTTNPPSQDAGHHPPFPAAGSASSEQASQQQDTEQQNTPVVDKKEDGTESSTIGTTETKAPLVSRFLRDVKRIIFASWVNWLLVFVPVGIILGILVDWVHVDAVSPSVVFAINAVAIIPLASLLAYATESVASKMGDTVGALLNVTFGNAVELIIFIIALAAGEVRVVQAAAIGSILSNLLLILGMAFVVGGLRFREQLYNSTVSQMSACLLCLSVISLVLPTAFHASFNNPADGNQVVIKVSRGTSIVLLLVYGLYLLFSLKSHSFMYASTPQHIIDEESHPGFLADILNSSSSSSDSSSSSSSDSDSSHSSHTTAKRIKRVLRRRRRKSISSSKEAASALTFVRTPSDGTHATVQTQPDNVARPLQVGSAPSVASSEAVISGDEADLDGEGRRRRHRTRSRVLARDFENGGTPEAVLEEKPKKRFRRLRHKQSKKSTDTETHAINEKSAISEAVQKSASLSEAAPQVGFSEDLEMGPGAGATRRPFNIRNISEAMRPAFNSTTFPHHLATARQPAMPLTIMRPTSNPQAASSRGLRRTSSMPEMIHPTISNTRAVLSQQGPNHPDGAQDSQPEVPIEDIVEPKQHLSQTSAIVLLLCTTGLVALCAEFLVGSIDYLIANSGVSQAFIGLIILPIVGNAAEHVTAVLVAAKNKMDLAINIALGSSIQIALFVMPLMVILGWIIKVDMSLYFSLFETVSLFASAFIVGFLMIDGRSNYLEGSLLIAAYIIIAVCAYFYPNCDLSAVTGPADGTARCPT